MYQLFPFIPPIYYPYYKAIPTERNTRSRQNVNMEETDEELNDEPTYV